MSDCCLIISKKQKKISRYPELSSWISVAHTKICFSRIVKLWKNTSVLGGSVLKTVPKKPIFCGSCLVFFTYKSKVIDEYLASKVKCISNNFKLMCHSIFLRWKKRFEEQQQQQQQQQQQREDDQEHGTTKRERQKEYEHQKRKKVLRRESKENSLCFCVAGDAIHHYWVFLSSSKCVRYCAATPVRQFKNF